MDAHSRHPEPLPHGEIADAARRSSSADPRLRMEGGPQADRRAVLSHDVLRFLEELDGAFESRRQALLRARGTFRQTIARGQAPSFLAETEWVRASEWSVAAPPPDLVDRRVEITGPTDRKMVINALNSGARVYMADFEDAHAPVWTATLEGQANLFDAVRRRIEYTSPDGRGYRLNERPATLMVRPRGWHLDERHLTLDGRPLSASLVDFGIYIALNARELVDRGTGPYFYLPKMEHHLEARLWNDVFQHSEQTLGLAPGTIRATALIETLPAAFQMDEILYELRDHSVGLNCGRWDYLFSFIKQFQDRGDVTFPDRDQLTMSTPFLTAYSHLLIRTCHRRGAHAMGGMAAQIPIKDDPAANEAALAKVADDKEREVRAGHDGTWVAHPGLVTLATEVFDRVMPGPNQISRPLTAETLGAEQLLAVPPGSVTERGVRRNARVALRYLESWLRGIGCVPIDGLMEDAATAEIARTELWHWVHHGSRQAEGRPVTVEEVRERLREEREALLQERGGSDPGEAIQRASHLLDRIVTSTPLAGFITTEAYPQLDNVPPEES